MTHDGRDRIRLGTTRWWTYPEFVLRSAGFPVADVESLCDEELTAAADAEPDDAEFAAAYEASEQRTTEAVRRLAGDPCYREAMAWQNPALSETIDKLADGSRMANKRRRQRTATFVNYVQRYATKNDTIGFFGPLAWSRIIPGAAELTVEPGPDLLSARAVFFEWWAMDVLARMWSADPEVIPWLRPSIAEHWCLDGRLTGPRGREHELSASELKLIRRCDGTRTVAELSSETPLDDVPGLLADWTERGILVMDLAGPFEPHPEDSLRARVALIGDQETRERLLATLDEMTEARDRVAAAAGSAGEVQAALAALNEAFERITGTDSSRRHGETYAGRTLVYEETSRDVDVELGSRVLDRVAEPLSLILDSAAWLVDRAAVAYADRFRAIFEQCRARTGRADVPLDVLVGAATRDLHFVRGSLPPIVADLSEQMAKGWQAILRTPEGVARHSVRAHDIAAQVRARFPSGPLPWSSARYHCPDLMIAAADADAISRGEFTAVLGEIHVALNTLDGRAITSLHPDPSRLGAYARADHGTRRVVPVPSRFSSQVTSRTYPPVLLSEDFTYWTMYPHSTGAPGPVLPASALVLTAEGERLTVTDVRTGRRWELLEVLGDLLSAVLLNAFEITEPGARHRPRVTIDELVVTREAWTFEASELGWAEAGDEAGRFRQVRRWRRESGLPRRVFYRVAGEVKPVYLDFSSPALVNLAAAMIRKAVRLGRQSDVVFSEMLPGPDECWLPDGRGHRYTSELRLVFTDPEMV